MDAGKKVFFLVMFAGVVMLAGCDRRFVGGAVAGTEGTGTAYEQQNREALKRLDEDRAAGRISQEEYDRRKAEIEKHSVVY